MTIRANNTHIIYNDGTTQDTGNVITRVVATGNGHNMIASITNNIITLKILIRAADDANSTHYILTGSPPPVGNPVGGK
jgi:3-keto-L-gulonate-6-phosphate decarboxylase